MQTNELYALNGFFFHVIVCCAIVCTTFDGKSSTVASIRHNRHLSIGFVRERPFARIIRTVVVCRNAETHDRSPIHRILLASPRCTKHVASDGRPFHRRVLTRVGFRGPETRVRGTRHAPTLFSETFRINQKSKSFTAEVLKMWDAALRGGGAQNLYRVLLKQ